MLDDQGDRRRHPQLAQNPRRKGRDRVTLCNDETVAVLQDREEVPVHKEEVGHVPDQDGQGRARTPPYLLQVDQAVVQPPGSGRFVADRARHTIK